MTDSFAVSHNSTTLHDASASDGEHPLDVSHLLTNVLREAHPEIRDIPHFHREMSPAGSPKHHHAPDTEEVLHKAPGIRSSTTPPPEEEEKEQEQEQQECTTTSTCPSSTTVEQLIYFESNVRSWYIGDEHRQFDNLIDCFEETVDEIRENEMLGTINYAESMRRSALDFAEAQQWATIRAAAKRERRFIEETEEDAQVKENCEQQQGKDTREEAGQDGEASTDEDEESGRAAARRTRRRLSSTLDLWRDAQHKLFKAEDAERASLEELEGGNRSRFHEVHELLTQQASPTKFHAQYNKEGGADNINSSSWPRTLRAPNGNHNKNAAANGATPPDASRALLLETPSPVHPINNNSNSNSKTHGAAAHNATDVEDEEEPSLQGRLFPNWQHVTERRKSSLGRISSPRAAAAAASSSSPSNSPNRKEAVQKAVRSGEQPHNNKSDGGNELAIVEQQEDEVEGDYNGSELKVPLWLLDDERAERDDIACSAAHYFDVLHRTMQSYVRVSYDWSAAGYRPNVSSDSSIFRNQRHRPAHLRDEDNGIHKAMQQTSFHQYYQQATSVATASSSSPNQQAPRLQNAGDEEAQHDGAHEVQDGVERTGLNKAAPPHPTSHNNQSTALTTTTNATRIPQRPSSVRTGDDAKRRSEAALRHAAVVEQQQIATQLQQAESEQRVAKSVAQTTKETSKATPKIFFSPEGQRVMDEEVAARQQLLTDQASAFSAIVARGRNGIRRGYDWSASGVVKVVADRGEKEADQRQRHLPPYMRNYGNAPTRHFAGQNGTTPQVSPVRAMENRPTASQASTVVKMVPTKPSAEFLKERAGSARTARLAVRAS